MSVIPFRKYFPLFLVFLLAGSFFGCGSQGDGSASSNQSGNIPIASEGCGDAELDAGEGCDDGNWENSDGCNAHCGLEVGEAFCGNGVKENNECCDDGNLINGDGCTSVCTLEAFNRAPTAPVLADDPVDGAVWAPTRLYLSWSPSTDSDLDDSLVYDVYFVKGNGIPGTATSYKSGVSERNFIIQASTDGRSKYFPDRVLPIYLEPLQTYTWMICARDNQGAIACSPPRTFNTDNSIVGWWRFDESPVGPNCPGGNGGETVCDYSGNNNHGIPNGSPTWLAAAPDVLGRALGFNGTNDYVSVQNAGSINPDSMSVIALLKSNGDVGPQQIIDKRNFGAGFNLRVQGDGYPLQVGWTITESDETNVQLLAGSIDNNTKYHLVSIFDSVTSEAESYINASLAGSINFGALNRTAKSTANLLLGDDSYNPPPSMFNFKGMLDEILIFNRILPKVEITNNYNTVN